ncbi:MAG TPA: glycine betaine ABC transporter substrate-binding protein, partial [Methanomassiliicoccaceae archaeon]|nr:glycine betaine ABC transporter substrate-binding protein [Methanomassiliicoccaceae archaeon]
ITRKGFADEHPGAYAIIKAFNWTQEDCQSVMRDIFAEGMDEREAAQKWIDANRERGRRVDRRGQGCRGQQYRLMALPRERVFLPKPLTLFNLTWR